MPHQSGDMADLVEPAVMKARAKPSVPVPAKPEAERAAAAALAGKWSVVRAGGQRPCALQLKTAQFGANYAASSVCFGRPNVWAWTIEEDALVLFDHKSEVIGSFRRSETGGWNEAKEGGGPALRLVRLGS
ncbi:AprI/Inh family metalloprotease inhibitor [Pseudovibrio japonicus]|nr:AprI/Inh family metalloprotease inhibitor [Pseudovibrio japonicus]